MEIHKFKCCKCGWPGGYYEKFEGALHSHKNYVDRNPEVGMGCFREPQIESSGIFHNSAPRLTKPNKK